MIAPACTAFPATGDVPSDQPVLPDLTEGTMDAGFLSLLLALQQPGQLVPLPELPEVAAANEPQVEGVAGPTAVTSSQPATSPQPAALTDAEAAALSPLQDMTRQSTPQATGAATAPVTPSAADLVAAVVGAGSDSEPATLPDSSLSTLSRHGPIAAAAEADAVTRGQTATADRVRSEMLDSAPATAFAGASAPSVSTPVAAEASPQAAPSAMAPIPLAPVRRDSLAYAAPTGDSAAQSLDESSPVPALPTPEATRQAALQVVAATVRPAGETQAALPLQPAPSTPETTTAAVFTAATTVASDQAPATTVAVANSFPARAAVAPAAPVTKARAPQLFPALGQSAAVVATSPQPALAAVQPGRQAERLPINPPQTAVASPADVPATHTPVTVATPAATEPPHLVGSQAAATPTTLAFSDSVSVAGAQVTHARVASGTDEAPASVEVAAELPLPRHTDMAAARTATASTPASFAADVTRLVVAQTKKTQAVAVADPPAARSVQSSTAQPSPLLLEIRPTQELAATEAPDAIATVRATTTAPAEPQIRELRLELAPAHLGTVTLELHHQGQQVEAFMVVDHAPAREIVQAAEQQVRELLGQQGLQVGAFEVSCRGGNPQEQSQHQPTPPVSLREHQPAATTRSPLSPRQSVSSVGGIDLYA